MTSNGKKKKSSIFFNTPCHQVFRKWGEITLSLISSLTQGSPCTMAVLAGTHPLALGTSPPAGQGEGPPPSPPTALRIFPCTVRGMVKAHRAPCQCLLKQLASSEMCTLRGHEQDFFHFCSRQGVSITVRLPGQKQVF